MASMSHVTRLLHAVLYSHPVSYAILLQRPLPRGLNFSSRGGDVTVYVSDITQPSLPTSFYSVLVSVSVFMALSTVFHSTNSPDNSSLSHSVRPVLFLYWSLLAFSTVYLFIFFIPDIILCG